MVAEGGSEEGDAFADGRVSSVGDSGRATLGGGREGSVLKEYEKGTCEGEKEVGGDEGGGGEMRVCEEETKG